MFFAPFYEFFPELAEKETRTITVKDYPGLPAGNYGLIELYCNQPDCDCRRVFFSVFSEEIEQVVATIAYGWESSKFYAKWMGYSDPFTIQELKGPVLNPGSPQSELAPAILKVIKGVVLQDKNYINRLKTHYSLFKSAVEKKGNRKKSLSSRKCQKRKSLGFQKRR